MLSEGRCCWVIASISDESNSYDITSKSQVGHGRSTYQQATLLALHCCGPTAGARSPRLLFGPFLNLTQFHAPGRYPSPSPHPHSPLPPPLATSAASLDCGTSGAGVRTSGGKLTDELLAKHVPQLFAYTVARYGGQRCQHPIDLWQYKYCIASSL